MKGFKKCCISNAIDDTDGGMLWNGSKKDANVSSKFQEEVSGDCEETMTLVKVDRT